MKMPEHLRPLARQAKAEGWTISRTRGGHLCWKHPRGPVVITGSSPHRRGSGPRMERRDLERAGLGVRRG